MRKITLSLLLFTGLNGWLPLKTTAQEILTLEKALEIAYKNRPTLRKSKITLEQSEANLIQRHAGLKAQFSMSLSPFSFRRSSSYDDFNSTWYTSRSMSSGGDFSITQPIKWTDGTLTLRESFSWQDASNQSSGGSNTSFSNSLTLSLSQPIFTYNRTKIELKQLEFQLELAKLNYAMAQLNLEKNVTQAFYDLYRSYKQLATSKESYQSQKETYELTKAKVENGIMNKGELFQAEINLANDETKLYQDEINYESTKDNFKQLLGLPLDIDIAVLANVQADSIHVNLQDAIKYALTQRTEIRQYEIDIEEGLFNLISAKATNEFKGSISATVGLTGNESNLKETFKNQQNSQNVSVSLSVPIYDWGVRKAAIKRAELSNENTAIGFEEQKKTIVIQMRQLCRSLPISYRQIHIAKQSLKNAEITYEINYEKYLNGNMSSMDFKQYQKQLSDAKDAVTEAIISYKMDLLNLKIQTLWDFETNQSCLPVDLLNNKN